MTSFGSIILANIGTIVSSVLVAKDADNRIAAYFIIVFLFLYNTSFNIGRLSDRAFAVYYIN